eukprot:Amastigsp_a510117_159.p3 type:complete len:145 gc:universal Amastigsp_a510117_159:740-306(-)
MGGEPSGECLICYDDITAETYAEYKATADGPWLPALICANCIQVLLDTLYNKWVNDLKCTKCAAEQRRMLARGPPVNVYDAHALPAENDNHGEIAALWFAARGDVSPKLKDSLEGQARLDFWNEQKQFQIVDDKEATETEPPAQ